jgi:hypothetical protein
MGRLCAASRSRFGACGHRRCAAAAATQRCSRERAHDCTHTDRLYLSGYDLTPTYKNVGGKFSVRYYLNLVLVDEEERRYFKQQEITLWRRELG